MLTVAAFLNAIEDKQKRADSKKIAAMMRRATGFKPYGPLMKKLGKHKHGSSCLYIKRLADIDEAVLEKLIVESVKLMRKRYHV